MRRIGSRLLAGALLTLTLTAYLPVWDNDFVNLDDQLYITNNRDVIEGWTWSSFRWAWTTYHGTYWQPLSWLSLQGDAHLFSRRSPEGHVILSPAAFHGQNLLWHCGTVLLLFGLWKRLTESLWRSFLIAALFAVHPFRVESVAWAAERKDVLSCFFGALTLWAYVLYLERPSWARYLGLIGCYALSLLSKPMLMTLPLVLVLLDYWPLGRLIKVPVPSRRSVMPPVQGTIGQLLFEKLPLFLLSLVVMLVTLHARQQTWAGPSFAEFPLFDRLAVAAIGYGWYLSHSLFPIGLAALYPHPHHLWSGGDALAGTATLVALTALCVWKARQRPWLLMGWLWFVGALAPVMGLALNGEQSWADRFTYWPHIGLLAAVVWEVGEAASHWHVPTPVCSAGGGVILVVFAVLTWIQVGHWRDTVTLWARALTVTQNNYVAHDLLGNHYLEQRRPDLAAAHFAESVRIHPESAIYRYKLARVLHMLGRDEEAASHLETVIDHDPDFFTARDVLFQVRQRLESRQPKGVGEAGDD